MSIGVPERPGFHRGIFFKASLCAWLTAKPPKFALRLDLECLCLAKTLADFEINNIAGGPLPEFCYNSDYAQRALARVRVAPSNVP